MKRVFAVVLVAVLVVALAVPGVAFARKGGVPASARGRGHGVVAAPDDAEQGAVRPGKGKGAKAGAARGAAAPEEPEDATEPSEDADGDEAPAPEVQKRTGVANALDRLQRNLARMQAQLDAGQRTSLPAGLQRVIAKFMAWLGLDGGSETPPPDDGASEEPTGTVEPTSTVEPTGTIEPAPVEPVVAD
ncbi:MAG: hypothetical protein QMD76_04460 [Anaerosomatales bacterium]|nr:hypothetical protein [Anaerosomatales bacterium]